MQDVTLDELREYHDICERQNAIRAEINREIARGYGDVPDKLEKYLRGEKSTQLKLAETVHIPFTIGTGVLLAHATFQQRRNELEKKIGSSAFFLFIQTPEKIRF